MIGNFSALGTPKDKNHSRVQILAMELISHHFVVLGGIFG